ncbi:MAG: asparagine synthase-related protein [Pseudomonas sp.]
MREQVGNAKVLLGLSGGVDSSVVAALLHKAIGDQLTCVFVDNGLLRLHEGDQVMAMFAENMGVKVIRADAEEKFLGRSGRRQRPGAEAQDYRPHFIDVFDDEASQAERT